MEPTTAELKLYEGQLNFVESMMSFHPDSIDMFSEEEQAFFRRYFLPDWDDVDDFRQYYCSLIRQDPAMKESANRLLRRYMDAHHVVGSEELLME